LVFKVNINEFEIYNTVSTIRSRALLYCLTFGGMRRLPQLRGGACFCTRYAMQDYAVITYFSRWQKPWHQERDPDRRVRVACAAITNLSP